MNATSISLSVRVEHWPIAGRFAISRGTKTEAAVVVAELFDGRWRGRGECVPYAHYGETVAGVHDAIAALAAEIALGLDRATLQQAMQAGAARAGAGVTLVEQPLPADRDAMLARIGRPLPICADESVHGRTSLAALAGKYDAVNIKLDKTGGLTEALAMAAEAERLGFDLMVGCMVATSLSMAPAMLVAQHARVIDLDGPLLLARDREHGLRYEESLV